MTFELALGRNLVVNNKDNRVFRSRNYRSDSCPYGIWCSWHICSQSFTSWANTCFKNINFPRANYQPIAPQQSTETLYYLNNISLLKRGVQIMDVNLQGCFNASEWQNQSNNQAIRPLSCFFTVIVKGKESLEISASYSYKSTIESTKEIWLTSCSSSTLLLRQLNSPTTSLKSRITKVETITSWKMERDLGKWNQKLP